jgi:hypothetical protein
VPELSLNAKVVRMERERWRLLAAYTLTWFAWQAVQFEPVHALPVLRDFSPRTLNLGSLAVWCATVVWLFSFMVRVRRDKTLRGVLNDELNRANRQRAFMYGYWAVVIGLGVSIDVTVLWHVDAFALVRTLLMIAVSVPLATYLWFDRSPGR